MLDFTYYAPTKVFFGKDKHKAVGEIIRGYGFEKIMMMYGKGSIKKSGLYDEVIESLNAAEISVVEVGGVDPNPNLNFVKNAIEIARNTEVEMILAVGGGSVIDAAKFTAAGTFYNGDPWGFPTRKATPERALPVGTILTIAAAGSEMSSSAVITNQELNMKRGFNSELNRCLFSICNPELTYTLPPYQTACGVVDMMAHTMERYFTLCEPTPLTDSIAESILKSIINAGKILVSDPENFEARATVMWASSLAHNDLTGCGRENFLAVHQLEHALSGEDESIAHGAGLAVLFPAWGRYMYKANSSRFADFARNVWGVTESDDEKAAYLGIEAMAKFFRSLGMPSTLREFGIEKKDIPRLCELCTFGRTRTIKSYIEMDYEVIREIFESCY